MELNSTERDLPSKVKLVGNSDELLGGNRNGVNMPSGFHNLPDSVEVQFDTSCVSIFVLCKQCFLAALKTDGWLAAPISCSIRSGSHHEIRQHFQLVSSYQISLALLYSNKPELKSKTPNARLTPCGCVPGSAE